MQCQLRDIYRLRSTKLVKNLEKTGVLYGAEYRSALERSLTFGKFSEQMSWIFLSLYFDKCSSDMGQSVAKPCPITFWDTQRPEIKPVTANDKMDTILILQNYGEQNDKS